MREVRLPLRFAHEYLATPLPRVSYPYDVTGGLEPGMMGNDTWGNCGPVSEVELERTTAVAAGVTPLPAASNLAIQRYVEYTGISTPPGPGVVGADYFHWLWTKGVIKAFAPLDHSDRLTVDAFTQAGFGTCVGVSLTGDAEQLFAQQQPWTLANGEQPNPDDGHFIEKVGASEEADEWWTWGGKQSSTLDWSAACIDEAWLLVTTEEQMAVFTPALLEDITALEAPPPLVSVPPKPIVPSKPSLINRVIDWFETI